MNSENSQHLDLDRLRTRLWEKPRTKVGQVRQAWPYIKELFAAGHSLKDIWAWLNEIGIEIGYARLSHYIGQLRRAEQIAGTQSLPAHQNVAEDTRVPVAEVALEEPRERAADPLANLRHREQKLPVFNYNSEPDLKKLI